MDKDKSTVSSIEDVNKSIFESEAIQRARNLKPVVNTPAKSPNTKGQGGTIFGRKVEAKYSSVDKNMIPIFPMRYVFTAQTLMGFAEGDPIPTIPTDVNSHEGYELVRIRRGYLYVLDDQDTWQVFWYETNVDDENGSTSDGKNPNKGQSIYSFTKYTWKNGAKSEWTLDLEGRRYPFAFVNKDRKSCWVAYSEDRWPGDLFEVISRDMDARRLFMREMNLSERSGQNCFPLEEISQRTNCFADQPLNQVDTDPYALENILRYTSTGVESDKYLTTYSAEKMGIVAAVNDPMGYHLDVARTIEAYQAIAAQYYEENEYAITIGTLIRNLQNKDVKYKYLTRKRKEGFNNRGKYWTLETKDVPQTRREGRVFDYFADDPLHPKFEEEFSKYELALEEQKRIDNNLIKTLLKLTVIEDDSSLSSLLNRINQEIDGKSLDEKNSYYVRYLAQSVSKAYRLLSTTHSGALFTKIVHNELFGYYIFKRKNDKGEEEFYDEHEEIKKSLEGLDDQDFKKVREKLEHLKNLVVVLEHASSVIHTSVSGININTPIGKNFKVAVVMTINSFPKEIAQQFVYEKNKKSWKKTNYKFINVGGPVVRTGDLARNIIVPQRVKIDHITDLRAYFEDTLKHGGTNQHKLNFVAGDTFGFEDNSPKTSSTTRHEGNKSWQVETMYKSIVQFELDEEGMNHFRYNQNYQIAQNGFGMFLGLVSLFSIIEHKNDPNRAYTDAGRFVNDPRVQLIQMFADVTSDVYSGARAVGARSALATEVAANHIAQLFTKKALANWSVAIGPEAHEFARNLKLRLSPLEGRLHIGISQIRAQQFFKGVGLVGVFMAGMQLYDSFNSRDNIAKVGDGLNLLGSILLLSSVPLFLFIGFLVVVGGAFIKTFAFDDFEKWIEAGYWGISDNYWGITRDTLIEQNKTYRDYVENRVKDRTNYVDKKSENYDDFLKKEQGWFYDLISSPKVFVDELGDAYIYCAMIFQESEIDKITATLDVHLMGPQFSELIKKHNIERYQMEFVSEGVVKIKKNYFDIYSKGHKKKKFSVVISREPNGKFEAYSNFF